MKQLAKALKKRKQLEDVGSSSKPSSSTGNLSLTSPITRLVAEQIGKGKPAHLLQRFASAAIEEAGSHNVTDSILFCLISRQSKNMR